MELTEENKAHIDGLSFEGLLSHWRNAPLGDKWFQGESGEYWQKRMNFMRDKCEDPVAVSKKVGWEG